MNPKSNYEIEWTELGLAFAEAKASKAQVESQCRAELMEFLPHDEDIDEFVHTVVIGPYEDNVAFYVAPQFDAEGNFTKVLIDSCVWEEGPVLTEGEFKGKKPMFPRPASQGRT